MNPVDRFRKGIEVDFPSRRRIATHYFVVVDVDHENGSVEFERRRLPVWKIVRSAILAAWDAVKWALGLQKITIRHPPTTH